MPDSPHEPDPEPYEPMPPRLIPLDEVSIACLSRASPLPVFRSSNLVGPMFQQDSSMLDDAYAEPMDTSQQQAANDGTKLPPVIAKLMVKMSGISQSPPTSSTPSNVTNPAVNVQELLTSIMVCVMTDIILYIRSWRQRANQLCVHREPQGASPQRS